MAAQLALTILLVTFALLDAPAQPHTLLPATAPGNEFSAGRAQELLARFPRFLCIAPACDDAVLEISLESNDPLLLFVSQTRLGLPDADQDITGSRPPQAAPRHMGDVTMLVERITVGVEQK